MRLRSALFLLALIPALASAQQLQRVYVSSPLAAQHHLPFSSGVRVGNTLYIAGTTGVDPNTKGSVTPTQEARLVMDRIKGVVEESGMKMDDVVSIQVFCTDLRNYGAFNSVYRTYFHGHYPARTFIAVSNLLFGARYEVNGVAVNAGG
jgi:2-iminobutanoate/2-iminopropanoate deaminase